MNPDKSVRVRKDRMKVRSITVEIPIEVYLSLMERAKRNFRSLTAEVAVALTASVGEGANTA